MVMDKKEFRKNIKTLFEGRVGLEKKSEEICKRLLAHQDFVEADIVVSYMALKDEVDLSMVNEAALKLRKKLALPRIVPGTNNLEFYFMPETDQKPGMLETGSFGILEPDNNLERFEILKPDYEKSKILILVPGRAFSSDGKRLGRGKGFYDKFLSESLSKNNVIRIGICFDFQLFPDIPAFENDVKMNLVISG